MNIMNIMDHYAMLKSTDCVLGKRLPRCNFGTLATTAVDDVDYS